PEVPDGERVLGVFLNSLPFRFGFAAGSWTGLAHRAFAAERELLPHRRFPLAELQRGHGALFDTLFNFTHFHVTRRLAGLPGLDVLDLHGSEQTYFALTAHFDLDPVTGSLALMLIYDAGRLSATDAERLAGLYERVLTALAAAPDAPGAAAVICGDERLTYRELWARAEAVAERLRDLGTRPGARVAVCLDRGPELIATLLGVLLAGAAYVPVDPA